MSEVPYASDTRAKGWRFELDHERIRQSDTWALCPAEYRPWLLMLWMVAWEQTPCGSMPDDDALICARIGMAVKTFAKAKESLMRGWWRADDGRLYHKVITERVLEMLERRRKEAERKRGNRGKPQDADASPMDVPRETTVTDDTGTRTGTSVPNGTGARQAATPRPKKSKSSDPGCPQDVDAQVWADWLALRKKKAAPVTETVIAGARAEAAKAQMSFNGFLKTWCLRGSQGLEASWLKPTEKNRDDEREWHQSQSGVERRAKELGIAPWNEMEEQWPSYRQRVMTADKGGKGGFKSVTELLELMPQKEAS